MGIAFVKAPEAQQPNRQEQDRGAATAVPLCGGCAGRREIPGTSTLAHRHEPPGTSPHTATPSWLLQLHPVQVPCKVNPQPEDALGSGDGHTCPAPAPPKTRRPSTTRGRITASLAPLQHTPGPATRAAARKEEMTRSSRSGGLEARAARGRPRGGLARHPAMGAWRHSLDTRGPLTEARRPAIAFLAGRKTLRDPLGQRRGRESGGGG